MRLSNCLLSMWQVEGVWSPRLQRVEHQSVVVWQWEGEKTLSLCHYCLLIWDSSPVYILIKELVIFNCYMLCHYDVYLDVGLSLVILRGSLIFHLSPRKMFDDLCIGSWSLGESILGVIPVRTRHTSLLQLFQQFFKCIILTVQSLSV